ncbi:MAG: hypothetical protein AAB729_02590, partial [Patescibacteria group bacterium]
MLNKLLKGLLFGFFLIFIFFGINSKAQAVCTTTWSAYSNPFISYSNDNTCGPNSTAGNAAGLNK